MKPPTPTPPEKLLRVEQVAEALGVSIRKIWRLISTGALRSVRIGQRGTRIRESVLAAFMSNLPKAR